MSAFFNFKNDYIQNFPVLMPEKCAQALVVTTGITLVTGASVPVALSLAGLSVVATAVESVVRPIFHSIFPGSPCLATFVSACFSIGIITVSGSAAFPHLFKDMGTGYAIFSAAVMLCLNYPLNPKESFALIL